MKPENAIEVREVVKKFRVYLDKGSTLKEVALFSKRRRYEEREVLRGISFEVKRGEAIGLIGHNGCGKSTMLKLLTKIMYPDAGTIEMKGRVSSLIELGAGFHPDMSGRQNIYTNASIFGLTRKEIDARLQDIINFSELGEFIDNPVRTYSSGMYMRLAFSVAINVDADILLIDEILAVGDAAFQAKCFNRLREIKANGTTIVIVSHALGQIEQICERSIWIHNGLIEKEGIPRLVHPDYMKFMSERVGTSLSNQNSQEGIESQKKTENTVVSRTESSSENNNIGSTENVKRWGSREVVIDVVRVLDENGVEKKTFQNTESLQLQIHYKGEKEMDNVVVGIAIYRDDGTYIYGDNTLIDTAEPFSLKQKGTITLHVDRMPLTAGVYSIDLALHRPDGFNYDFWRDAYKIQLTNPIAEVGLVSISHTWEVK